MAKAKKAYYFAVKRDSLTPRHSDSNLLNFIDMLRYDSVQIVADKGSYYLLKTAQEPTEPRWRSFLIPIWHVTRNMYETGDLMNADFYRKATAADPNTNQASAHEGAPEV